MRNLDNRGLGRSNKANSAHKSHGLDHLRATLGKGQQIDNDRRPLPGKEVVRTYVRTYVHGAAGRTSSYDTAMMTSSSRYLYCCRTWRLKRGYSTSPVTPTNYCLELVRYDTCMFPNY